MVDNTLFWEMVNSSNEAEKKQGAAEKKAIITKKLTEYRNKDLATISLSFFRCEKKLRDRNFIDAYVYASDGVAGSDDSIECYIWMVIFLGEKQFLLAHSDPDEYFGKLVGCPNNFWGDEDIGYLIDNEIRKRVDECVMEEPDYPDLPLNVSGESILYDPGLLAEKYPKITSQLKDKKSR